MINQVSLWFTSRCLTLFFVKLFWWCAFHGSSLFIWKRYTIKAFPVCSTEKFVLSSEALSSSQTRSKAKQGAGETSLDSAALLTQPPGPLLTWLCNINKDFTCICSSLQVRLLGVCRAPGCLLVRTTCFRNHFSFYLPLKHRPEPLSALMCHLLSLAL